MKRVLSKVLAFLILIFSSFGYINILANDTTEESTDNAGVSEETLQSLSDVIYLINYLFINKVDDDKILEGAIKGAINSLDDQYSAYYSVEEYQQFLQNNENINLNLGLVYKIGEDNFPIVIGVIEKSYANRAGFIVGDEIISINEKLIDKDNLETVISENINNGIYKLEFSFMRDNEIKNTIINISPEDLDLVTYKDTSELPNIENFSNNICYIKIDTISKDTSKKFLELIEKAQNDGKTKLILDLRGNLGGDLEACIEICSAIIPTGEIISIERQGEIVEKIYSELEEVPFEQIAVLTDKYTASSAEIIASAIKDSGIGFTVGLKTYGKGLIQQILELPNGGIIRITVAEYYTRNGDKVNNIGIEPTFWVKPILFVTAVTDTESERFQKVLEYIGYNEKTLPEIQEINGLEITGKLDRETVNLINDMIYIKSSLIDDILIKAYEELSKYKL